jgi:hypothetical protein
MRRPNPVRSASLQASVIPLRAASLKLDLRYPADGFKHQLFSERLLILQMRNRGRRQEFGRCQVICSYGAIHTAD